MKFLVIILFTFLLSNDLVSQKRPDDSSNYRFQGDTTEFDVRVVYKLYQDDFTDDQYYKTFQQHKIREWSKHYGFVRVWWIDPDSRKWISRYMLDYYWRYSTHVFTKEIVSLDENLQPIKLYKTPLN